MQSTHKNTVKTKITIGNNTSAVAVSNRGRRQRSLVKRIEGVENMKAKELDDLAARLPSLLNIE